MTFRQLRPNRRVSTSILTGLLLLIATGCAEEPISNYKAPRPDGQKQETIIPPKLDRPPMSKNDPSTTQGTPRILGAVIPEKGTTYYVKLTGPDDVLEKHLAQFDQFVGSLKFTGKAESPLSWTVPEGWKPGKGNQFSLAAFALPVEGRPIEVTISPAGGLLLDNLNRWRGQVGLAPVENAGLNEMTKPQEIDGRKAYRVDLKGETKATPVAPKVVDSGAKDAAVRIFGAVIPHDKTTLYIKVMGPAEILEKNEAGFDQFLGSLKFTANPAQPLSWTLPEGWMPGKGSSISIAAFALPNTPKPVEVTITPAGGSLLDNLNRWRTQLSLPIVDESKMGEMSKEIQIDGRKAYRVSLKGTGGNTGMMTPPFMKK